MNETVASGLSLPLSRPWLLATPIVLDMLLWLGMQIPITRITGPLADEMTARGGENGDIAAEQLTALGETFRLNDVIGSLLPSVFAGISRDNVFNAFMALFAPGLTGGIDRERLTDGWADATGPLTDPGSVAGIIGLGLLFFLGSTLLTVSWRVPLALSVTNRSLPPMATLRLVIRAWVRFVAVIALLGTAAGVVLIPLLLVAGILLLLQGGLGALMSIFIVMAGSIVAVYARFVLESIIVDDVGPIDALRRSALIAQTFFGPTVRFSIVAIMIATGALRLWDVLIESPPGLPIAIIVNSFIGTGIAVASMMFYHDRHRLIRRFAPAQPTHHDHSHPPL